jgi:hypothetical protein
MEQANSKALWKVGLKAGNEELDVLEILNARQYRCHPGVVSTDHVAQGKLLHVKEDGSSLARESHIQTGGLHDQDGPPTKHVKRLILLLVMMYVDDTYKMLA